MSAALTIGQISDVGRVRKVNEDGVCALVSPNVKISLDAFLAVADGMGGHNAGRVASNMAVTFLSRCYSSTTGNENTARIPSDISAEADLLRTNIKQLNNEIYAHSLSKNELHGMGTTLVTVLITGDRIIVAHVGDSRAYLISTHQIRQITDDHSWVAEQIRAGLMQPEEAEMHPWRNVISRAVGIQPDVCVDITSARFTFGDTVILCSDGLTSMVTNEEILQTVVNEHSPQTVCENLTHLANRRGGLDNITIVAARID